MARKVKSDWIGARVDDDLKEAVEDYIDVAHMSMGDLVRIAIKEYIKLHPVSED